MYRRIRDLREDRDLLQRDLAAYLQCSQVCYSHYETAAGRAGASGTILPHQHRLPPGPHRREITLPKAPGLWSPIAYFYCSKRYRILLCCLHTFEEKFYYSRRSAIPVQKMSIPAAPKPPGLSFYFPKP